MKSTDKSLAAKMLDLMEHAFRAGHELALHDAIVLCHHNKQRLPDWVMAETARRSRSYACGEKPERKRGRHGAPLTKQRELLEDAKRFDAVQDLMASRKLFWEAALEVLSKTKPLRGYETLRKSYLRHNKRLKTKTFYVSLLCCQGDYVGYLNHNDYLLNG